MGCSDSKAADPGGEDKARQNGTTPKPPSQEQDQSVTAEEACKYISTELGISDSKAKKIVDSLRKDKDGRVDNADLESLKERINGAKKEIEPLFKEADPDGDGHVTLAEGAEILAQKFPAMPPEALRRIAARFDSSGDGTFQYGEFVVFYSHCKSKQNRLKELFDKLDADDSGTLDKGEVVGVLVRECDVEPREAEALLEQADQNSDGTLDKKEFECMWNNMFGATT